MQVRIGDTVTDTFPAVRASHDRTVDVPMLNLFTIERITYADAHGIGVVSTNGQYHTILLHRPQDYIVWDRDGDLVSI